MKTIPILGIMCTLLDVKQKLAQNNRRRRQFVQDLSCGSISVVEKLYKFDAKWNHHQIVDWRTLWSVGRIKLI